MRFAGWLRARRWALLGVCGLSVVVARAADDPERARATFPGPVGQIAFVNKGRLHLVNPDGSNDRALVAAGVNAASPSFSADGTRIAYAKDGDIFVIGSDGAAARQLTTTPEAEAEPAFSPDGTQIVFSAGGDVNIMNADGTGSRALMVGGDPHSSSFFPDGQRILYDNLREIYQVGVDGSGVTRLSDGVGGSYQASVSPDAGRIAFTGGRGGSGPEVFAMDADGGGLGRLTVNPAFDGQPAFSPDGRRIAFISSREGGNGLWTMDADGSDPVRLVDASADRVSWGPLAPSQPAPVVGRTANVAVAKGTVLVKERGSGRFVPLTRADQIPIGSQIDATRGTVALTMAAGGGKTQTGTFRGGRFKLAQKKGKRPITNLKLTAKLRCTRSRGPGRASRKRRRSRRLFGNAHGRFRTRGRHSTATIRGTKWLVKDTCRGTLTVSKQGTVVVRDLVKHRIRRLRSGQRYLARPRR